jgi:hypothetical protein
MCISFILLHHTSDQHFQILAILVFTKFFRFCRVQTRVSKDDTIIPMGILDNFEEYIDLDILKTESAWDQGFQYESSGLKVYSEICSNGCTCQTSDAHKPE